MSVVSSFGFSLGSSYPGANSSPSGCTAPGNAAAPVAPGNTTEPVAFESATVSTLTLVEIPFVFEALRFDFAVFTFLTCRLAPALPAAFFGFAFFFVPILYLVCC